MKEGNVRIWEGRRWRYEIENRDGEHQEISPERHCVELAFRCRCSGRDIWASIMIIFVDAMCSVIAMLSVI